MIPSFNHSGVLPPFVGEAHSTDGRSPYATDLATISRQFVTSDERRDREVSRAEISRARSRADLTRIAQEQTGWIEGQIVGFTSKSFEFAPAAGEKLTGRMDPGPARLLEKAGMEHELDKLLFTPIRAKFQVRTVANGSLIRRYHTLIAIDDRSGSD
ncbi:hypothetical protein [Dyella sp.]|uniref:hypothetical protein n=1 Tax=Dyella sp. TaxID=1869338 RepID=UPI003217808B